MASGSQIVNGIRRRGSGDPALLAFAAWWEQRRTERLNFANKWNRKHGYAETTRVPPPTEGCVYDAFTLGLSIARASLHNPFPNFDPREEETT